VQASAEEESGVHHLVSCFYARLIRDWDQQSCTTRAWKKERLAGFDGEEVRLTRYLWWQFEESKAQATAGEMTDVFACGYDGEVDTNCIRLLERRSSINILAQRARRAREKSTHVGVETLDTNKKPEKEGG
jgi:hypothetical protein